MTAGAKSLRIRPESGCLGIDFLRHPLRRFIGLSEETSEECSAFEDMKKGLPTCRQSRLYTAYLQPHSYEPHMLSSLLPE